jgi:hypothetical protein
MYYLNGTMNAEITVNPDYSYFSATSLLVIFILFILITAVPIMRTSGLTDTPLKELGFTLVLGLASFIYAALAMIPVYRSQESFYLRNLYQNRTFVRFTNGIDCYAYVYYKLADDPLLAAGGRFRVRPGSTYLSDEEFLPGKTYIMSAYTSSCPPFQHAKMVTANPSWAKYDWIVSFYANHVSQSLLMPLLIFMWTPLYPPATCRL